MSGFMAVKRRLIYRESEFSTRKDWVLSIHTARIKLLLDASALGDGGWKLDPDKLSGNKPYIDPDDSKQTEAAIHDYEPSDGCAYGTFFKYEKEKTVRYYFLFTCWGMQITNNEIPDMSTFDTFPIYYANLRSGNNSDNTAYINYPGTMGYAYGYNPFVGTNPKDRSFIELSNNSPLLASANEMYIRYDSYSSGSAKQYYTDHNGVIPNIIDGRYIDLIMAVNEEKIANMFHYSVWNDLVYTCVLSGDFIETQIADPSATTRGVCANVFSYYSQLSLRHKATDKSNYYELTAPSTKAETGISYWGRKFTQSSLGKWVKADMSMFLQLCNCTESASITAYTLPLITSSSESICSNGWLAKGFFGESTLRATKVGTASMTTILDGDFVYFNNLMLAWDKTNAERVGF